MLTVLLVLASAAADQTATPPAAKPVDADQSKIVCKRFPPPVGTRLGERKICKSKAEWDAERADNMMQIQQAQQQQPGPRGN